MILTCTHAWTAHTNIISILITLLCSPCSYLIEKGVCYLVLCEGSFPKKLAFAYLEDLQAEFHEQHGKRVPTVSRPYSFIEFGERWENQEQVDWNVYITLILNLFWHYNWAYQLENTIGPQHLALPSPDSNLITISEKMNVLYTISKNISRHLAKNAFLWPQTTRAFK